MLVLGIVKSDFLQEIDVNNISLTASGDLVAYAMTEDNWHNNYYESPTFYKDGNKNVKPDMRMRLY